MASFEHQGNGDSTVSDILVTRNSDRFYIEIKSPHAQSGQFVLIPNMTSRRFDFSVKNKTTENELTAVIIDFMNEHWDKYKDVSTKGLELDLSNQVFSHWITDYYRSKHVRYFISGTSSHFIIIPIAAFPSSFSVTASYRCKRSGTRRLSASALPSVSAYLEQAYPGSKVMCIGKHAYLKTPRSDLNKTFFNVPDSMNTFYLSKDDYVHDGYRVSVRSVTNNPNVIFSINLLDGVKGIPDDEFAKELESGGYQV